MSKTTTASKTSTASSAPKNGAAAQAAKAEKATYLVVSPLHHDGEAYAVDDQIELSAEQAEPLLGHTVKDPKAEAAE